MSTGNTQAPVPRVYTDGACRGNPGRGGWAIVIVSGAARTEASGHVADGDEAAG